MLSRYERRARLTPGLMAMLPISFAITALGLERIPVVACFVGLLSAAGGTYVVSVLVAAAGLHAQKALWSQWDGSPTVRFLRTRDQSTNTTQRDIWRTAIINYTGVNLLTAAEESGNEDAADNAINAAVGQCLYLGHGGAQGETVVAAENARYGFERNVYGFRWFGRGIAVLAGAGLTIALSTHHVGNTNAVVVGLILEALFLVLWLVTPSKQRTKEAAERYATQLLNAVARESREGSSPTSS